MATTFQKYHDELFPPAADPDPETLAQAALFIVLKDIPTSKSSPWTSLGPRRFGGDVYERLITFQPESTGSVGQSPASVRVKFIGQGLFDICVDLPTSKTEYKSVSSLLSSNTSVLSAFSGQQLRTTVVSQPPAPTTLATHETGERLHVFHGGRRTSLLIPAPRWLQSLGEGVLEAAKAKGGIRAPMPSLVVDVRVQVGDMVDVGQAVVVLESMKTETVLRAGTKGTVKGVACKKGDMVEEGRELIEIDPSEESS